jgi:hypothetical protein
MRPYKSKNLCSRKEMISKLKRPPTGWEKIFARYTSDKGLIIRIYREHKKLNSPQINEPIKKWASELNRTLSKEELPMAKRHMKKCSPFLAIKDMQIKTTLRFHLTPVRIAVIITPPTTGVGEDVKKKEHLYSAGGNANNYNHSGKKKLEAS